LKKTKTKEKPLVKAETSSHGLVITRCCPLLDFETKPSVSVFVFVFVFFLGFDSIENGFVELSSS
jgi:hypothetical protein